MPMIHLTVPARSRTWSYFNEQPDGTWGVGGSVIRSADLVALAQEEKVDA